MGMYTLVNGYMMNLMDMVHIYTRRILCIKVNGRLDNKCIYLLIIIFFLYIYNFFTIKHGNGKECWPDGSYYIGKYNYGMKEGLGAFTWSDNAKYIGNFDKNLPSG